MPTVEEEVANLVTATNNLISEVSTQKSNLDTSEANAAASATAASTSEGNAATSETNAAASAESVKDRLYTVDTIADMLVLDPVIFPNVNVLGYNSINDGGGGIFNYDASQSGINT